MTRTHPSTHPPIPPTTEDDRVSWLRLLRSYRVGPTTFFRLLEEYGNAENARLALPEIAQQAGVKDYVPCPEDTAIQEMKTAQRLGAQMLCYGDGRYPADLMQIPDAPPILWAIGQISLLQKPMVALVGARNASSLGIRMARGLAEELAQQGFVIVSGLARGIDTAAHIASVKTGTIAVMAGGADVIYPAENTRLGEQIGETGVRLSETPFGIQPRARDFPRRNRIISGLSQALIVVEAAQRSGSLLTARNALDQGREVLAVPGHPMDPRSAGCNLLIRDGARLTRNAQDVLEALPARQMSFADLSPETPGSKAPKPKRTLQQTAALHSQILDRLGPTPIAEDQLIRDVSAPATQITPILTDLELDGRVARHPGGLLTLVS